MRALSGREGVAPTSAQLASPFFAPFFEVADLLLCDGVFLLRSILCFGFSRVWAPDCGVPNMSAWLFGSGRTGVPMVDCQSSSSPPVSVSVWSSAY